MNPVEKAFKNTTDKLNSVGCGMCLAKWTQSTIHLQIGHTHSCHHPVPHKIPVEEIIKNPTALHNTSYKKARRKEMLTGKRPKECDYCWKVEDNSDQYSDRTYKSHESWSSPHFQEIVEKPWDQDFNPRYVEIGFSNACNFKCSYCGPSFSSQWVKEIKKHGAYPTTDNFNDMQWMKDQGRLPYDHKEYNPYVEAFWKWWPDLYRDLHTFRITGGEPLLAKDTWKILDYIIKEPNPNTNLSLSINSNLGINDNLVDRFIEKVNRITDPPAIVHSSDSKVKELTIFTSVDTWGPQADYIRDGLEFNKFWDNMNKILTKCPRTSIGIMSTYNALSIPNYHKLIKGVFDLKKEYGHPSRAWTTPVVLDPSYLRYPLHQTVQVLPLHWADQIDEQAKMAKSMEQIFHHGNPEAEYGAKDYEVSYAYTDIEIGKIRRISDWMRAEQDPDTLNRNRANFYRFFSAHDKRRGTDFIKTFPEFENFYYKCKDISDKL